MPDDANMTLIPQAVEQSGQSALRVNLFFRWLVRFILFLSLFTTCYWLFSSDRYVSEGIVIVQNTEQVSASSFDLMTLLGFCLTALVQGRLHRMVSSLLSFTCFCGIRRLCGGLAH